MIIAGPCKSSGKVDKGDIVLAVNGQQATPENISHLMHTPDVPGSQVTLKLLQQNGGHPREVILTRMSVGRAMKRKKFHDLIVALRLHLQSHGDGEGEAIMEQLFRQWTQIGKENYDCEDKMARNALRFQQENNNDMGELTSHFIMVTERIRELSGSAERLRISSRRETEELEICSDNLAVAHEDLQTATTSLQECRQKLAASERALLEERDAALQEQKKLMQTMEQLREALTNLRRDHQAKKEELSRNQDRTERLIHLQARNDSLVASLQSKIQKLETDSQPQAMAGIGIVCDDDLDNGLRIRTLVKGGAAENSGLLQEGDVIERINGEPVQDAEHALSLVHGAEGTSLVLQVRRPSRPSDIIQATLIRKMSHTPDPLKAAALATRDRKMSSTDSGVNIDPILQSLQSIAREAHAVAPATAASPSVPVKSQIATHSLSVPRLEQVSDAWY